MPSWNKGEIVASPLIRRLRLGDELRERRHATGLSSTKLGERAGLDRLTVERIERGDRRPDTNKVMALLDALGVDEGSPDYLSLIRMSRDAGSSGWWDGPEYRNMGDVQRIYADIESGAASVVIYSNAVMPGVLQTADYMNSRFEAVQLDFDDLDPVTLTARMRRQQELVRPGGARLAVFVEEQVIRRPLVPAEVMVDQLQHLLDLQDELTQFSLHVVPVDAPFVGVGAPMSPFSVHRFADAGDGVAVLVEMRPRDQLIRDAIGAGQYVRLADRLRDVAMSEADSAAFLRDHMTALKREKE